MPSQSAQTCSKFAGVAADLRMGEPKDAALGVAHFLRLPEVELAQLAGEGRELEDAVGRGETPERAATVYMQLVGS